jgi:site-specific recombinase XerD
MMTAMSNTISTVTVETVRRSRQPRQREVLTPPRGSRSTLDLAVEHFLVDQEALGFTMSTVAGFDSILRQFLGWLDRIDHRVSHPADITEEMVAEHLDHQEGIGRPVRARAKSCVVLRLFFDYLADRRVIEASPLAPFEFSRGGPR